ncbi:hypothetical protein VNO77_36704 [Canavalia gladiata]|uniref:F-box domain-containing protein n=1 Tax=Canavalia gladiata TaxID=3824 RepID=A0AAN9PXX7_CANGL
MAAVSGSSNANEYIKSLPSITTFNVLPPEIIYTHILSRLDGVTLVSVASVSSFMYRLCIEEDLWHKICNTMWPSLLDPTARRVISTFPGGYRSVYSDVFPFLHHFSPLPRRPSSPPSELISAIDIYYKGNPILSRVKRTETNKNWFLSSSLWMDVLEPDEFVPTPVKFVCKDEEWMNDLEENLNLSWIVMDPNQKRAANVSSWRAVSVARHWLTREVEVVYAAMMAGERQTATEMVQCVVKVTCCGKVGAELHVREVNLVMEDTEGRHVSGNEGMKILQRAMQDGKRKRVEFDGVGAKERFQKFSCLMKERRESKHRREKARDVVSTLLAFIALLLFCFLAGF